MGPRNSNQPITCVPKTQKTNTYNKEIQEIYIFCTCMHKAQLGQYNVNDLTDRHDSSVRKKNNYYLY